MSEWESAKSALRGPRNLHIEGHRMLCLRHRVLCLPRNLQTTHISKSHDPLLLSRSLSSSMITTVSTVPATKTAFRSKTARLSRKVDFGAPKHEVSLAPATKSDHHVPKCARRHNESAVVTSARSSHPDSASLRSRSVSRGVSALYMAANQPHTPARFSDLSISCFPTTVRIPQCAHTVWGINLKTQYFGNHVHPTKGCQGWD